MNIRESGFLTWPLAYLFLFLYVLHVLRSSLFVKVKVTQSCPALCNPMDCSFPGSWVHGILQAKILECVAISFSRGSLKPRDQTQVSCIAGRFFTIWATREALLCLYDRFLLLLLLTERGCIYMFSVSST